MTTLSAFATRIAQRHVAGPGRKGQSGRRAADRSRHDARPDGEGERRRRQIRRRRSLPVRSAHEHRRQRRRAEAAARQGGERAASSWDRWWRQCGRRPAAARRWGATRIGKVPDADTQGVRDRQKAARSRHPQVRRDPHRLGVEPRRLGERSGGQHSPHCRHIPSGLRHRRRVRRASRRRRRDLLGRHAQLEADGAAARDGEPAEDAWLSRPTWRTTFSSRWATTRRTIACFPRATTGRIARSSMTRTVMSLARFGRGPSISTSRRTTPR